MNDEIEPNTDEETPGEGVDGSEGSDGMTGGSGDETSAESTTEVPDGMVEVMCQTKGCPNAWVTLVMPIMPQIVCTPCNGVLYPREEIEEPDPDDEPKFPFPPFGDGAGENTDNEEEEEGGQDGEEMGLH